MELGVQTRSAMQHEPDREQFLEMYAQMLRIRLFEEQVNVLYTGGKMPGLAHLYICLLYTSPSPRD